MQINEYQDEAIKLKNPDCDLVNLALGISGEAGEVADIIKKHIYHKHKLNKEELMKELGDVCWYIAVMADEIGYGFESVLYHNIEKLHKRFPNGFETERSINRAKYEN